MSEVIYKECLEKICRMYSKGDATEPSYYNILTSLLEKFAVQEKKSTEITILPRKTEVVSNKKENDY